MKRNYEIRKSFALRFTMALLAITLLGGYLVPAYAASINTSLDANHLGVIIELNFYDDDTVVTTDEMLSESTYVMRSEDSGLYLLAERNESDGCYYVAGATDQQDNATVFLFGNIPDHPERIEIRGLSNGDYSLIQTSIASGFAPPENDVSISLTESDPTVDGTPVEWIADAESGYSMAKVPLGYSKPFELPGTCQWCALSFHIRHNVDLPLLIILWSVAILASINYYRKYAKSKAEKAASAVAAMLPIVSFTVYLLVNRGVITIHHGNGAMVNTLLCGPTGLSCLLILVCLGKCVA